MKDLSLGFLFSNSKHQLYNFLTLTLSNISFSVILSGIIMALLLLKNRIIFIDNTGVIESPFFLNEFELLFIAIYIPFVLINFSESE